MSHYSALSKPKVTDAGILRRLDLPVFNQFRFNPEAFIARASTLIKEKKATVINERLAYDPIDGNYDSEIRAVAKTPQDFSKAFKAKNHIYEYVFTETKVEREFAEELDVSTEVKVYARLVTKSPFVMKGRFIGFWACRQISFLPYLASCL